MSAAQAEAGRRRPAARQPPANRHAALPLQLDLKAITTADATTALSLCSDVLLPAVEQGGIDIASIVELQSCSTAPPCLEGLIDGA